MNHVLYVDDQKIFANTEAELKELMDAAKEFFSAVGLEMNKAKSADSCREDAELLGSIDGYKYLGIIEDPTGVPKHETFLKLKANVLARVDLLCKTKLNARNLFRAINEFALSSLNLLHRSAETGA